MNKNNLTLLLIFSLIFSFSILAKNASATVGGPSYISEIRLNTSSDSVYYVKNDYGGKGCPPIIHAVNLATTQDVEVKTCDQAFKEFFSGENGDEKYRQFIMDTYKDFLYLGSISLKKNHIDVRVNFLSEHIEGGETYWSDFEAIVTQDNKEVAKINFRGCDKDQPHVFEGYMVPDSGAMALVISNKGDCFEGGYIYESLYLIKSMKYYDTKIVRSYKTESATEPNSGNMVVFADSDDTKDNNDGTETPVEEKTSANQIILLLTPLVVGIILGYVIGKKSAGSK